MLRSLRWSDGVIGFLRLSHCAVSIRAAPGNVRLGRERFVYELRPFELPCLSPVCIGFVLTRPRLAEVRAAPGTTSRDSKELM